MILRFGGKNVEGAKCQQAVMYVLPAHGDSVPPDTPVVLKQRAQGVDGHEGFDGDFEPVGKMSLCCRTGQGSIPFSETDLLTMAMRTRAVNLLKRAREAQTPNTALQKSTM